MNWCGVIPVLVTPFHADASVDEESLRRQVDFCIANGVAAVCAPAFGSEYYKLSDSERMRIAEVVIQHVHHRKPVLVNTGAPSAHSTKTFCRHAESMGADGLMVAAPRAVPLGYAEFMSFFEEVCRCVKIPVMIQDADFQGGGLPEHLFVELAELCPNFQSVKLENPLPGERCEQIVNQSHGKIKVHYGWGGLRLLDGLAHGACGIMPGPALSRVFVHIFTLYNARRMDEAQAWFYRTLPFLTFALEHVELFIQMEKQVLMRMGVIASERLREPTLRLGPVYQRQAKELTAIALQLIADLSQSEP